MLLPFAAPESWPLSRLRRRVREIVRAERQFGIRMELVFLDQLIPGRIEIAGIDLPLVEILLPVLPERGKRFRIRRNQGQAHAVGQFDDVAGQLAGAYRLAAEARIPAIECSPVDQRAEEFAFASAEVLGLVDMSPAVEPDFRGIDQPALQRFGHQSDQAFDVIGIDVADDGQLDAEVAGPAVAAGGPKLRARH